MELLRGEELVDRYGWSRTATVNPTHAKQESLKVLSALGEAFRPQMGRKELTKLAHKVGGLEEFVRWLEEPVWAYRVPRR